MSSRKAEEEQNSASKTYSPVWGKESDFAGDQAGRDTLGWAGGLGAVSPANRVPRNGGAIASHSTELPQCHCSGANLYGIFNGRGEWSPALCPCRSVAHGSSATTNSGNEALPWR